MSSGVEAVVQAEKLLQVALLLPCAAVVGWLIGAWADKHFHQSWMAIAGILFGAVSGLVYVIRMALTAERGTRNDTDSQNSTGEGTSGPEK